MANQSQKLIERVTDYVKIDRMDISISYRFWQTKREELYDVKSITFDGITNPSRIVVISKPNDITDDIGDGILIPSTTLFDKEEIEIYSGDIVNCDFLETEYKDRVVFWDNGWRVIGCTTEEFKMNCPKFVTIVGDIYNNEEMYTKYLSNMEKGLK